MAQCKRFETTVALKVQSGLNRDVMLLILNLSKVGISFMSFHFLKPTPF